jgi:hypothetical protein
MPTTMNVAIRRQGGWEMQTDTGGFGGRFGTTLRGSLLLTGGQITVGYENDFTIAAGATLAIDLKGGNGELNLINLPLVFTRIWWAYVELTAPSSTSSLKVGPLGQANAWQGWHGGTGSTHSTLVTDVMDLSDRSSLWTAVGASTKVLAITNPGASPVSGTILLAGN